MSGTVFPLNLLLTGLDYSCQCLHACILSSTINENLRPPSIIGLACRVGSIMSIHDSHTQWMLVEVEQPETHRFFDEPRSLSGSLVWCAASALPPPPPRVWDGHLQLIWRLA
ncbi:hypothetical protein F5879DRAFT_160895 [Lentinula edodes]|nr:hypothetical protein F5879DRAFT_160895 [Lentinula edodes]